MRSLVPIVILVVFPTSSAIAQVDPAERDALIALYNSTDGANWSNHGAWLGAVGTECGWWGVQCDGGHVAQLSLSSDNLNGALPPELGNLVHLVGMQLWSNQLNGSIPSVLGTMSNLERLYLSSNQLSGVIPPALGSSSSLSELDFSANQLSGAIPPELAGMSNLRSLDLSSNRLSVVSVRDHTVWLSWDAVSYQADPGGYSVFSAPTGSGVWTLRGQTEAKTILSYPVAGLDPGTSYDLAVASYTNPHADNLNLVDSDLGFDVMATTAITAAVPNRSSR